MARFVLRPYRTSTTYHEPQGAGRRGLSRDRRRAAPGPDGDRRAVEPAPDAAAGRRRGRRDPARTPAAITSSGSSSSTTATTGPGSSSRPSPRAAIATSSASTGPSTPSSRRPSWRRARRGSPCDELLLEFRKLAVLVDKTGGPAESRRSLCCTTSYARPPPSRARPGPEALPTMTGHGCSSARRAGFISDCWAGGPARVASSAASA